MDVVCLYAAPVFVREVQIGLELHHARGVGNFQKKIYPN